MEERGWSVYSIPILVHSTLSLRVSSSSSSSSSKPCFVEIQ
jgi:hypothetical protein